MPEITPSPRPGLPAALHPELVRLQAGYDRVVDDFEAGHLTLEEAQITLGALAVIDASGAMWGVDDEGRFVRRQNPDQVPAVTNPGLFAAARVPVPAGPPLAPWQDPALAQPRVQPSQLGVGAAVDGPRERRHRNVGAVRWSDRVLGALETHRRTVLVVAFCVAVLAAVLVTQGGGGTGPTTTLPDPASPSSVPGADDSVVTTATTGATTTTVAQTTTTTAPVAAPTPEEAGRVISALSSGNRDLAVGELVDGGTAAQTAVQSAFYAGLGPSGLGLAPGVAVLDGPSRSAQSWRVVDEASGVELAVLNVQWSRQGTSWKLATWPTLAEPVG